MEKKDKRFFTIITAIIVITIVVATCVVVLNLKQTNNTPTNDTQTKETTKEEENTTPVVREITLDELKAAFPKTADEDAKEEQKVEMISCEEHGLEKCENYYNVIEYNGYTIRLDHDGSADINDYTITKGETKYEINNAITLFEVNGETVSVGDPIVKDGKFYFLAFKDSKDNEFYDYNGEKKPYLYYSYIDLKESTIKVVDVAKIKSTTESWNTYNAISLEG